VSNYLIALLWTIAHAILIILFFTYYVSVARDLPFRKRFSQMALISLGVAALSFAIGYVVREVIGIEI
jgi:VIT1/CCC1 family predicted Fe2+/Mn2+ transporter